MPRKSTKKVVKKVAKKSPFADKFFVNQNKYRRAVELAKANNSPVVDEYVKLGGVLQDGHGYKPVD